MNNTESDALLWKAVNLDLTSRGGLRWEIGSTVTHPTSTKMVRDQPSTYLSLSAEPAETLIGRGWPARLLRVEPLGEVITSGRHRHKRCALSVRVVDEVDSWRVFGPQGEAVVALIHRAGRITADEVRQLAAAGAAARGAARGAAMDAAWALVVRDVVSDEHFATLTGPWVSVMGSL